jgi:hypothetical protein
MGTVESENTLFKQQKEAIPYMPLQKLHVSMTNEVHLWQIGRDLSGSITNGWNDYTVYNVLGRFSTRSIVAYL